LLTALQTDVKERIEGLAARLLRACRYNIALAERRFAALSPEVTIARLRRQLDRAQQRVDEHQFRLTGAWQSLLHGKATNLQQLHARLLQQSSFHALGARREHCAHTTERLNRALQQRLTAARRAVDLFSHQLLVASPAHRCQRLHQSVDSLETHSARAIAGTIERARARHSALDGRLAALSPLAVLDRGYSLTFTASGKLVRDSAAVAEGDTLRTRVARGAISSTVVHTEDKI
jgi:exodeoxyribonuclease VII large subunit